MSAPTYHLPAGMPRPVAEPDGLDAPYWEGTRQGELRVQRCRELPGLAVGSGVDLPPLPELRSGVDERVEARGMIYSWERAWHPVHPALRGQRPYVVVLVELPQAGGVRMVGNLLGDPDAGGVDRRARGGRVRAARRRDAAVHAGAMEEDA